MSTSLQDQLLQAGIASKKQHQQVRSQKKKMKKQGVDGQEQQRSRLEKQRSEQRERDKTLNLQREQQRQQKERKAQLRQTVLTNRVERREGEVRYSFVDRAVVRQWWLDRRQVDDLNAGRLGLVRLQEDEYALLPGAVVHRLTEQFGEQSDCELLVFNRSKEPDADSNDPYADYQIPDDLMW